MRLTRQSLVVALAVSTTQVACSNAKPADNAQHDASTERDASADRDASVEHDASTDADRSPEPSGDAGGAVDPSALALIDCDLRATASATEVKGDVADDTTWSGVVHITGEVDVLAGAKLNIAAGTHLIMAPDAALNIGWNNNPATVYARGTLAAPIRICGETGKAGFFRNVEIGGNVSSDSVLENVLVADGGGDGPALILRAPVRVSNVQVRNAAAEGVLASRFKAGSERLSVEGAGGLALVIEHADALTPLPMGGRFENNRVNRIALRFSDILHDTVIHDLNIPYLQEKPVDVYNAQLTLDAGVEIRFASDADLEIGWNSNMATIQINGTEAAPVTLLGDQETRGFWSGLVIGNNVTTNSTLAHLRISHAGALDAMALDLKSPIKLDHVTLDGNVRGVYMHERGAAPGSSALTVTGTKEAPLTMMPNALVKLPKESRFTGNDLDRVVIKAGDFSVKGTVPNLGVPYFVQGDVAFTHDSAVTLTEGTTFIMGADAQLEIGWNSATSEIHAVGTSQKPIRFIGADSVAGYWKGVIIGSNALSSSALRYVEITDAGGALDHAASLQLLSDEIAVENCKFSRSAGYGIRKLPQDATDYTSANLFSEVAYGPVGNF